MKDQRAGGQTKRPSLAEPAASVAVMVTLPHQALNPPRETPIASSSAPHFCARCVLVCADGRVSGHHAQKKTR